MYEPAVWRLLRLRQPLRQRLLPHIFMYIHIYIYTYTYIHIYIYMHIFTCCLTFDSASAAAAADAIAAHICIYVYMYICFCIYIYIYISKSKYMYVITIQCIVSISAPAVWRWFRPQKPLRQRLLQHIFMYIHIYIYTYLYIHIYIYMHIFTCCLAFDSASKAAAAEAIAAACSSLSCCWARSCAKAEKKTKRKQKVQDWPLTPRTHRQFIGEPEVPLPVGVTNYNIVHASLSFRCFGRSAAAKRSHEPRLKKRENEVSAPSFLFTDGVYTKLFTDNLSGYSWYHSLLDQHTGSVSMIPFSFVFLVTLLLQSPLMGHG